MPRAVILTWGFGLVAWLVARAWLEGQGVGWETYFSALNLILLLSALLILNRDIPSLLRPARWLYSPGIAGWHWGRSWLVLPIGAVFWAVPMAIAWAVGGGGVSLVQAVAGVPIGFVAMQLLLVGPAQELFFREAAIKASGGNPWYCALMAVVIFGAVEWQAAALPAWIAAGAGAVYLSARLAGVPILVVGLLHGATNVVIGGMSWPVQGYPVLFPALFVVVCLALAFAVLALWGGKQAGEG